MISSQDSATTRSSVSTPEDTRTSEISLEECHSSRNELLTVDDKMSVALKRINDALETSDVQDMKEALKIARKSIFQLNLTNNLMGFQLKNEKEASDIERQILVKNLEKSHRNLEIKTFLNSELTNKKETFVKYIRHLKNDKIKKLKVENLRQAKRIANLEKYIHTTSVSPSTGNHLLNTLGLLASHVLDEERGKTHEEDHDRTIELDG